MLPVSPNEGEIAMVKSRPNNPSAVVLELLHLLNSDPPAPVSMIFIFHLGNLWETYIYQDELC